MYHAQKIIKTKYILFDFDGVIADSFSIAFETVQTFCPAISEQAYRKRFEGNINENNALLEDFHSDACRHDLDWFSIFTPKLLTEVNVFPGMKEAVLQLEQEYTLIIVSSTLSFPIEEFLVSQELHTHFDWVMGNDVHKSKVEKIKMVFDKYQTTSEHCVFITDTLGDMLEAKKMNIPSIGVTWGFQKHETLAKGSPFCLAHTSQELTSAIRDYFEPAS